VDNLTHCTEPITRASSPWAAPSLCGEDALYWIAYTTDGAEGAEGRTTKRCWKHMAALESRLQHSGTPYRVTNLANGAVRNWQP
jgi:hypothetical protein